MCGKLKYATAPAAWRALSLLRRRSHRRTYRGDVYRCQFCHGWHLTSVTDWEGRRG